jgi:hypothetical protein
MASLVRSAGQLMDDALAGWPKDLADSLRETTRIQREIQQEFAFLHGTPRQIPPEPRPHTVSHRGPQNPLHHTWHEFVLDLQQLEARARHEHLKLTKANVARFGTDTPKTITRTMAWYGLAKTDWPPSTWDPNQSREGGAPA